MVEPLLDSDKKRQEEKLTPVAEVDDNKDDDFAPVVEEKKNLPIFAVFLLSNLLQFVYMLVQVCTKKLLFMSDAVSSFELAFFRSIFNFILSSIYLKASGVGLKDKIDSSNWCILFLRCMSGSVCFLCFVVAMQYIPLTIFFVILNATPFAIALLACLWLKEVISSIEIVTMVFAFGGILLVGLSKRGNEVEEEVQSDQGEINYNPSDFMYNIGLLVSIGVLLGQAVTLVATRRLKALSVFLIQWYYAVTSCIVTGIAVAV